MSVMSSDVWPALPYEEWKDTYATLHIWTQIVGKIALARAPRLNHSWAVALQITARGISTPTLPDGHRVFRIEFDFVAHRLIVETSDGAVESLPLRPQTVAEFHRELMATLDTMQLQVKIWPVPVEIPDPIPFEQDHTHSSYDPVYANRAWRIFAQVHRVLGETRTAFVGKCSPVHFFWGAFDVAVTRFSGRPAPPREGPAFMREAYSHEVISHGFWPGGAPVFEPSFYAYAVPQPAAFEQAPVRPDAAYYHRELGEFLLPYEAVRTTTNPDRMIHEFVESTYEQAATLGGWDRKALERHAAAL